jgi:hypothetical protein
MPAKDIKTIMEMHAGELMSIPGVVGVAVGETDDSKSCILVLVKEDTPHVRERIPSDLDGFPVVIEETGQIRAMPDGEQ